MIRHYYTLHHVVNELQLLVGCRLSECFTQEKNSLVLSFSDGVNNYYVQYFGEPQKTSLFIKNNFSRARRNTTDLFESVAGETLQSVFLHKNNRIVQFEFINTKIYFLLFGGSGSNVIAVNKSGIAIESLKAKNVEVGAVFEIPQPNLMPFTSFPLNSPVIDAISKCDFNFGKYYAVEVLSRLNIEQETAIRDLSRNSIVELIRKAEEIREECLSSKEYYILETESGLLFSLILLSEYPNVVNKFNTLSEGIYKRIVTDIRTQSFGSLFKEITQKLERHKHRLEKNIEQVKDEIKIAERAEKYKLYGELLLSHPKAKMKSGKEIEITDYSGTNLKIPLDDKLTLLENANKYFDKFKNTKEEIRIRKKRQPELELRLLKIENALKLKDEAGTFGELEQVNKKLKELTGIRMVEDKDDVTTKFREFDLGEGYILYVGKNAANNDELTMKFAKPNDLWFHARGSGGSHAVLRINKDQKPPKSIIKKAAAVVAYYSKSRNAKYTPVAYTYKKYVHKPKGANIGSVTISKEEVIMVEPVLPTNSE